MRPTNIGLLLATVCGGAFLWAVLLIVKKLYLDKHKVHEDLVVVATLSGATTLCVVVEGGMLAMGKTEVTSAAWLPLFVTGILNIGIQYWSIVALKLEDASVVGPLSATMPFWLIVLSGLLLHEWPTALGKLGIGIIGIGAYLIRLERGKIRIPGALARYVPSRYEETVAFLVGPWLRLASSKGARLALVAAFLGAISTSFDKMTVVASSAMFQTGGAFAIVIGFVWTWSKASGRWSRIDKGMFWPLFRWGLLLGVATVLMNSGYYFGIASYVGSLKRTQILWVVILSGIFLKEKNIALRLFAAALIAIGAAATVL